MKQHEAMVSPEAEEKAKLQIALPAKLWRETKSAAALRSMHAQDLVAEALAAHLGIAKGAVVGHQGGRSKRARVA